jgi:GNAT superfamily N-acetyltransferase
LKLELRHVRANELGEYVDGLRRLEASISYPIDDGRDHFTIDHGVDYHRFFSTMGDAHFLLALANGEVVGTIAGVFKEIRRGERIARAAYIGDLKLADEHRGTGLARRMLWRCLLEVARSVARRDRELVDWELAFGGAMRGEKGDVTRSARGLHLMRVSPAVAELALYFVAPQALAGLDPSGCPANPPAGGVDFSPGATYGADDLVSTAGRKDLRMASNGLPWPLVHLPRGPEGWLPTLGHYLRRAGEELLTGQGSQWPEGAIACFGIDERLTQHTSWLASQGLERGAVCTIYTLPRTGFARRASWYHLATSEI